MPDPAVPAPTRVVIENPVLNSPFEEPRRHFLFDDEGITDRIAEGRRPSSYFLPVAGGRNKRGQLAFDNLWTRDRTQENAEVNFIRGRMGLWRSSGYPGVTPTTRMLLEHWQRPDRERRLFFCQLEALETLIYLTEAAETFDDAGIRNRLREAAEAAGTPLLRQACKMATGSGKTVVMAMIVAWQVLNKRRRPSDRRFADAFLVVTPGITIRDRLRVLLPSDPHNDYDAMDLVPAEHRADLGTARVVVTNYHAFELREKGGSGKLTRALLSGGGPSPFTETPARMVRRVCRELGTRQGIIVLNDEAHHCYRARPATEKLTGDDRKEARKRQEAARLWLTGLEAVHETLGVRVVYDLSATPFYLKGSGYPEGTLFPWVVSDFSLIDAIESGVVKVPRVPIADEAGRDLWARIRDSLPRKSRGCDRAGGPPRLPLDLEKALRSLYSHYEEQYRAWAQDAAGRTPPVFIVVCCNTSVSKLVFDWIAGFETGRLHPDGAPDVTAGHLPLLSNVEGNRWLARPNTILVDSVQIESDKGMNTDFKKLAAVQVEEFKAEYRKRFPGRDAEGLTDEDLMREVLNTVGKAGKLGEGVRCVVSVSMLSEGWDARTVTHILGVRAFGTQLLCEQVIGRGLRRRSYSLNDQGRLDPEYAEVYGVPFSFIPCAGSVPREKKEATPTACRVRAMPERLLRCPWVEIAFPRVTGYRQETPPDRLEAAFSGVSHLALSTADVSGQTGDLKKRRCPEVAFVLARRVLARNFPAGDGEEVQVWLFPQVLAIVRRWLSECLTCQGDAFPQLLLLEEHANRAAEKIGEAMTATAPGRRRVRVSLQHPDTVGTTANVSFDTIRPRWTTAPDRCHLNFVPCESVWEAGFAQALEEMAEVRAYVKNQGLGFKIPHIHEGRPGSYCPDYLLRLDDGRGPDDLLNLIVEIARPGLPDRKAGIGTARRLWVPGVNAEGAFGRWDFLEISDPLNTQQAIQFFLLGRGQAS